MDSLHARCALYERVQVVGYFLSLSVLNAAVLTRLPLDLCEELARARRHMGPMRTVDRWLLEFSYIDIVFVLLAFGAGCNKYNKRCTKVFRSG